MLSVPSFSLHDLGDLSVDVVGSGSEFESQFCMQFIKEALSVFEILMTAMYTALGYLSVNVTGSGSGEAGSPYTLTCTITLSHRASDSSVFIQWQGSIPVPREYGAGLTRNRIGSWAHQE